MLIINIIMKRSVFKSVDALAFSIELRALQVLPAPDFAIPAPHPPCNQPRSQTVQKVKIQ